MKNTIYSDQTGKFPVRARSGNCYIMVMVHNDSNYTLVQPMKNRSDGEMIRAYKILLKRVQRAGLETKRHVLDNECSQALKELIRDTCKLELVPPGCHRRNVAEVSIKAFKQHFLSILAGLPDDFRWSLWDRLLPQAETTLNLLRQSHATPTVSAYAHLYGNFDYNRMPLAPMGCPCHVHVKSGDRKTWDFHSQKGHYLFTSGDHYRTHNAFINATKAERLSDTVEFQHRRITRPRVSHADHVIRALADFVHAIKSLTKGATAGANKAGVNMKDLQQLAKVTSRIIDQHHGLAKLTAPNQPSWSNPTLLTLANK